MVCKTTIIAPSALKRLRPWSISCLDVICPGVFGSRYLGRSACTAGRWQQLKTLASGGSMSVATCSRVSEWASTACSC